jgi:hypothetical protein
MSERSAESQTILDNAWSEVVGGMDWLKSVFYGEFSDHQSISTIVAQMLINFLPGVVIVTSARDAVAIILRLAAHPEKREDLMEWVLLSACLIVIALPIAMAAGGVAAAGVGAVVGGIAGSELGAALRAMMLMLIKEASRLVEMIRFLQRFIKGDILKFLRLIKFVKYEAALLLAVKKFTDKLAEVVSSLRLHLESLRYFESVKSTIAKLAEWERRFYAVQQDALKYMPKALAELDARLAKLLAQTAPKEAHMVSAGVTTEKVAAPLPIKQRIRDTPGKILAKVGDESLAEVGKPMNATAVKSNSMSSHSGATQPKEPAKLPLKDNPEPLQPHGAGANTKKQVVVDPANGASSVAPEIAVLRTTYAKEIDNVSTFKTIGLDRDAADAYLSTSQGQQFIRELSTADPAADMSKIYARAVDQLGSGSSVPDLVQTSSPLVKIVPQGQTVSPYSPFFTTVADLDAASKSGFSLADYFGLPIKSEASLYDIYQISPNSPANVFVSKVAPTSELGGLVSRSGGAIQYIVPNRGTWSSPIHVGTIGN